MVAMDFFAASNSYDFFLLKNPTVRGLRDSNRIILIGGIKFGDLVFTLSLSRRVLFERFHSIHFCN